MPNIGIPELLIVLVIVLVIFGASRLTDIMGAMGKGVAEFRKGTTSVDEPKKEEPATTTTTTTETPKTS